MIMTMPSYAELVFYVFSMSTAVDCRGSKLITLTISGSGFLYGFGLPTAPDIGMYNLLLKYLVYSKYF